MRTTCLIFLLIALTAMANIHGAFAQTPPLPQSKKDALGNLEAQAQARKDEQKTLKKRAQEIETALGDTRKQLLNVASKIRGNEKTLRGLEEKIEGLETEQSTIQARLEEGRLSISRLILALGRIRRVPPEAMLARPGTPLKTAQSAMLIGDVLPALTQQADALQADLKELEEVSASLSLKRDKALEAAESLRQEHNALSALVARREKLYASTQKDLKAQQEEAQRISQQSRNLQDLVRRLEEDKKKKLLAAQAQKSSPTRPDTPRTAALRVPAEPPKAGQARLPIEGAIRIAYDQPDNFGAPSKGLSIEGRSGALVVAPMGGIVRFAGHFKNHGNMVIIEHEKGFHSLVAGLGKIDTVVGQSVLAGEPLGLLDDAGDHGGKPALYYELRRNGKPVNPSVKFAGLG
ncbi:MAG: peptidoglycan DD-metalloendopeptidase family protein [Alphaproteobacteria bacterium]|nr:peptidoglycan DD-metalloendopeptidase family protein [Alphaproteobacteria bacterium]